MDETTLSAELQDFCARLSRSGGTSEVRLQALVARVFPVQASQHGILDRKIGVYGTEFFLRLIQAEVAGGRETGFIVLRSERVAEIRREKGEDLAVQVLGRLAEFLRPRQATSEWLGRIGSDSLALLLPQAGLLSTQERAQALYAALLQNSRFPVSVGVSHTRDLSGGAPELIRLADLAAEAMRKSGDRCVRTVTSRGLVATPVTAAPSDRNGPAAPSLAARYQRLVLLNRMSLELLSDKPFSEALVQVCSTVLALTQAKSVAFFSCDALGRPALVLRHGEGASARADAQPEEVHLLERALRERRILTAEGTRRGWVAAPLLSHLKDGSSPIGAFIIGFPEPLATDAELDQTVLEISRLLRNAWLMQKSLEHQKVLAAVTEQTADAICITDPDSRIVSWNTAAERLFGYPRNKVLGQAVHFLVPHDRLEELDAKNAVALAQGYASDFETVRLRQDGTPVPVEATFFLLRDEKERPFATVRVFRDITKRKELERLRSEFISLVTHELRTPLTSIKVGAEVMQESFDDISVEQRQHYLSIIVSESKRLGDLVTNFLDISSLEAGAMEPQPALVDISGLARRAASLFAGRPDRISFQIDFAPGSEKAWADEDQIYRVLVNLASNAVKYSPPQGTVTIAGRLSGADVEVSVTDQGRGIPLEAQGKLFQKFYRVTDSVSRKMRGTGLGLAICKGIVERHHGRILVESRPGQGTTFRFAFPREGLKPS